MAYLKTSPLCTWATDYFLIGFIMPPPCIFFPSLAAFSPSSSALLCWNCPFCSSLSLEYLSQTWIFKELGLRYQSLIKTGILIDDQVTTTWVNIYCILKNFNKSGFQEVYRINVIPISHSLKEEILQKWLRIGTVRVREIWDQTLFPVLVIGVWLWPNVQSLSQLQCS